MTEKLLYLSDRDVRKADVSMTSIIEALECMYLEKGHGRVEIPPKPGIHTRPNALIHAMPGYAPELKAAGLKWIGAYPDNPARGEPQITGLIVLNDVETGAPYCIMDCRWVTAKRTGAKTALAARYLARPDSRRVGILGCGVQGRSNLEALACLFDIEDVRAYDVHADSARRYADEMAPLANGARIQSVATPEEAVRDRDIVVTAGPILRHPDPVIPLDWLAPGALAAPVDFDSYWKEEVLQGADRFVTDDVDQMFYYRERVGYFQTIPEREGVADLGAIVAGRTPGRQKDEERIVVMSLGLALDDIAAAPLVYEAAKEKGLGIWLER